MPCHLLGQRGVAQNMALGSFQQDQYRLIKGVLRLPGAVRFELGDQGAKAMIQQPWIVDDDMALAFIGLVHAKYLGVDGGLDLFGHLAVDEIFH
ncbi:Uncharacterised protein [Klebsiella pneumoniae]|nr:Uncharacterised protein [Klebsiella pneumoniae]